MADYYLGIDTSNYKTSIAVVDFYGNLIYENSEFLDVKEGSLGLRQSEALFKHSNRIPQFIENLLSSIDIHDIKAIGVSTRPRRLDGSYMPCFLAGINAAKLLSYSAKIPLYEFSHQEGHAAAIIDNKINGRCSIFHLSGGTTEYLICSENQLGYEMYIVGGTKDISIGQLLDRIGVSLGYSFPAGSYLDQIAIKNNPNSAILPNISTQNNYFNLSGLETKIHRIIENNEYKNIDELVSTMFFRLSKLLYINARDIAEKYDISNVYMAGGVSSSKAIKSNILAFKEEDERRGVIQHKFNIIFREAKYCGDNAIGIAKLASRCNERK